MPEGADPEACDLAWKDAQDAENHILETAELAYVLQADGFPVPEVFKRIGLVLDPPSDDADQHKRMGTSSDPLRSYLIDYLRRRQPAYVALGGNVFSMSSSTTQIRWLRRILQEWFRNPRPTNQMKIATLRRRSG